MNVMLILVTFAVTSAGDITDTHQSDIRWFKTLEACEKVATQLNIPHDLNDDPIIYLCERRDF